MKNPVYAPTVTAPYVFSDSARWIHAEGVSNFTEQMFRRTFELNALPKQAVLLAMAATYAEIYINGEAAASLAVRSYIFDKAYEVYDVTNFLRLGKNLIAVRNIDTGEEIRAGFALELQADGETILVSDESFLYKPEEAYGPVNYFIGGGGAECVAAEKLTDGFADVAFDDGEWKNALVIGNELIHEPYRRFHQSMTKGQTNDVFYAETFAAILRAEEEAGYPLRFSNAGAGMTLAMTNLSVESDTDIMFVTAGGMRSIAIDGNMMPYHETIHLTAGTHFVTFAYGGSPELFIRTEGKLAFTSPVLAESPLSGHLVTTPRILYPWNQFRGRAAHDDVLDALLAVSTYEAMPEDVRSSLVPLAFSEPTGLPYAIHTPTRVVPKNGMAVSRIYNTPRVADSEKTILFENYESLLTEMGDATIPAQDGMVSFILDFGTERVGRVAFDLTAPAGTVLDIMFFEMLTDDGIAPMNGNNFMRYTAKEGRQDYIARRLHGFRYLFVTVRGNASDVILHDIHLIEHRYPVERSEFETSDVRLNTIYDMSVRTAEVCMLDLYCDCPGFEQNPWTGDARCTGLVNLYNFGAYDFDEQYLKTIANSIDEGLWWLYRRRNPLYVNKLNLPCACFPTYPDGCIPVWSLMWLLQVFDHYEVTGDEKFLRDLFPAVKETLARCERMIDDRGLFDMQGAWNLIEWANNDLDFYGEVTANNVMLSYCFKKTAEMAELLGENELAKGYRTRSDSICDAVNAYCWDEEKRSYVDTARDAYAYERYLAYMAKREMPTVSFEEYMANARIGVQSNTMALLYDCVPEERREDAIRFLLDNMRSGLYINGTPAKRTHCAPSEEEAPDGYVHIGSPFFLYFALSTLYKFGYHELALEAQRRDWGDMLDHDVRTCYETFITGKEWPRSAAHAWSATPALFLKTEVLGVKPKKAGFAEFTVEPNPSDLTFAKGTVPTPHGNITVSWTKNEDGTLAIECEAPKECKWIK